MKDSKENLWFDQAIEIEQNYSYKCVLIRTRRVVNNLAYRAVDIFNEDKP